MKLDEVQAAANVAAMAAAQAAALPPPSLAAGGAGARRIAIISDHASPLAAPGSIDCGGQNVYVAQLARELARAGHLVDVFTRRDAPEQRQVVPWLENIRVIHVPAGPPRYVPKEQLLPWMPHFARFVTRFARRQALPWRVATREHVDQVPGARQLARKLGHVDVLAAVAGTGGDCQGRRMIADDRDAPCLLYTSPSPRDRG